MDSRGAEGERMNCPHCGQELQKHDRFGRYLGNGRWDFKGEILKCENEDCEHAQNESPHFYTYNDSNTLHEGYPC